MKQIALIHTVASVHATFAEQLRRVIDEEVLIHNILDDFLATDPNATGIFSETNEKRLRNDIENAVLSGCDVVVTTCSTLSPHVEHMRDQFATKIITIDEAMAERAIELGSVVTVLATANSTVGPTVNKLQKTAKEHSKPLTVEAFVCTEAMDALRSGDTERHNQLVVELADKARGSEVCVLAQASMAHLQDSIEHKLGIPVLSSPPLCMQQVARYISSL
nr:aspartate/glutamate racemase family protein [uncultured Sphaerochaeta sp.]